MRFFAGMVFVLTIVSPLFFDFGAEKLGADIRAGTFTGGCVTERSA